MIIGLQVPGSPSSPRVAQALNVSMTLRLLPPADGGSSATTAVCNGSVYADGDALDTIPSVSVDLSALLAGGAAFDAEGRMAVPVQLPYAFPVALVPAAGYPQPRSLRVAVSCRDTYEQSVQAEVTGVLVYGE